MALKAFAVSIAIAAFGGSVFCYFYGQGPEITCGLVPFGAGFLGPLLNAPMPPCSRPASDSSPQTREVDSARTCLGPWQPHSRNARRVQESLWLFACRTCLHCGGREHIHSTSRLTSSFGPSHNTVVPRRLTIENGLRCRRKNGSHRAADRSTNGDDPSIGGIAKAIGMYRGKRYAEASHEPPLFVPT